MAKIDGLSFVARYVNGLLVRGATRGDGVTGKDITRKLALILPNRLAEPVTFDIRGEITLTGDDHLRLGFKNRRNGSVGLINRENVEESAVRCLRGFACQIKSGHFADAPVYEQLMELIRLGFKTTDFMSGVAVRLFPADKVEEHMAGIMAQMKESAVYDIDGLVVCDMEYCLEDAFLPDGMVAFKVNQSAISTVVTGIEWNVSKSGLLKPVVLVEPKDIDGTTVSRVTGYNAQWLLDNCVGEGAIVGIIKSGEIIPKIIEVYKESLVLLPGECPSCGTALNMAGVDLVCPNEFCSAAGSKEIESFLVKIGVDGVRDATLQSWGVNSFDDLLAFKADARYKSQTNLVKELEAKVFTAPADKLFAAMLFDGFGRKSVAKLIEFYGTRWEATLAVRAVADGREVNIPEGFGVVSMTKVAASWERNLETLGKIVVDARYSEPVEEERRVAVGGSLSGKSFLFTGTISMPRKQAEAIVTDNGGTIASGVSKNLAFLVAGGAAGSKLDKAVKMGVAVLTEEEFLAMAEA